MINANLLHDSSNGASPKFFYLMALDVDEPEEIFIVNSFDIF
ncbi:Uncharacterised protein (plasmid) [Legionella adelaidensis]|uniref:Uncharacterized protein n=1 Tax=Legionella adelaidensis TaxID=45056 RepID=A0A3S4V4I0_9GAMM|nr:Uncharacterised protein [Legionella adelaidensis]